MLIHYTGTGRRTIGEYTWSRGERTLEVTDLALIGYALTTPGERFTIADNDPLLTLVGRDRAGALVIEGVHDLATLVAAGVATVQQATGCTRKQAADWMKSARKQLSITSEAGDEEEVVGDAVPAAEEAVAADELGDEPVIPAVLLSPPKKGG